MEVIEFSLKSNNSNLAKVFLKGRYPEKGVALNTKCEMTIYVLEGSVVLQGENNEDEYLAGTAVVIPVGQKYYWKPQPTVTLLIFSTPTWTSEQQQILDY